MFIGNRHSANKLYSGIKHYESQPLTSKDIHEYVDTLHMKTSYLTDNLLGSGTLNEPTCTSDSSGIYLTSPSILLVEGDIALIQSDNNAPIVTKSDASDHSHGLVCILGWYEHLNSQSTLYNYGGLLNSSITNDITDSTLNIQVSTRYQFRWIPLTIDYEDFYDEDEDLEISLSDDLSDILGVNSISSTDIVGNLRKFTDSDIDIDAEDDTFYLLPVAEYTYANNIISEVSAITALKVNSDEINFISQTTEPTGEYDDLTIWYNPNTQRIKFYFPDVGFVATASELTLMSYINTITVSSSATTTYNMGIANYASGDIVLVHYEGVLLTKDEHYSLNSTNKQITLLGFTPQVGDIITILVYKLLDTSNAGTIATNYNEHVNTQGNSSTRGHVYLSDTMNNSQGVNSSVAVTPKALYDATVISDSVSNKKYKFVVSSGILYLEEV